MYRLKNKTNEILFDENKRQIVYDALYSENSLIHISSFLSQLENVIVFQFTEKEKSFFIDNGETIKIDLKNNKKNIVSNFNSKIKNTKSFIFLLNPPLELLPYLKITKNKFIIYLNQYPDEFILDKLKRPVLYIGRNFSNDKQSEYHNNLYYIYIFSLSIFEKIFLFLFVVFSFLFFIFYKDPQILSSIKSFF